MTLGARGGNLRRHVNARVVKVLPPRVRVSVRQSGGSRTSCINQIAILRSDGVVGFVV
jgi:hypothetical protein